MGRFRWARNPIGPNITRPNPIQSWAGPTCFFSSTIKFESRLHVILILSLIIPRECYFPKVHVNDQQSPPHFQTGLIGHDNAVARHGIRGLYHFYSVMIQGEKLVVGENKVFLTQPNKYGPNQFGPFANVMYDYIRLEGPPPAHKLVDDLNLFELMSYEIEEYRI